MTVLPSGVNTDLVTWKISNFKPGTIGRTRSSFVTSTAVLVFTPDLRVGLLVAKSKLAKELERPVGSSLKPDSSIFTNEGMVPSTFEDIFRVTLTVLPFGVRYDGITLAMVIIKPKAVGTSKSLAVTFLAVLVLAPGLRVG